jgi:hypothetical protein
MLLTLLTQIIRGQKVFRRANFLSVFSTPPGGPSGKLNGLKAIKAKLGESLASCYDTKTCRNQRFGPGKRKQKTKMIPKLIPESWVLEKRMSVFWSNNGRLGHSVRFLSYMVGKLQLTIRSQHLSFVCCGTYRCQVWYQLQGCQWRFHPQHLTNKCFAKLVYGDKITMETINIGKRNISIFPKWDVPIIFPVTITMVTPKRETFPYNWAT